MWLRDGFWIKSNFHTFRFNECQDDAFVLKAGKSFLLAKLSLLDPWFESNGIAGLLKQGICQKRESCVFRKTTLHP